MPIDQNDEIPFTLKAGQINHVVGVLQATIAQTIEVIQTLTVQAQTHAAKLAAPPVSPTNGAANPPSTEDPLELPTPLPEPPSEPVARRHRT